MHGDLKLDNIVTAGRELWLIDFEHARACTPGDVTFDLATVAVDTLIRGALVRRRYWPQVAAVVRGWLEGGTDPSFPPCFLLASAIQGGTLRPGRKAYPLAPPFGPSHKAIFRSLMEAAFAVVLDEASTAEAVDGYWEGLRGKWGAS